MNMLENVRTVDSSVDPESTVALPVATARLQLRLAEFQQGLGDSSVRKGTIRIVHGDPTDAPAYADRSSLKDVGIEWNRYIFILA